VALHLLLGAIFAAANIASTADFPHLWSTYSTQFQRGIDAREQNIRLAAAKLNGVVLLPNVEFSFNETVGELPPEETGYASAIIGEKRVPALGGGVCQVASTLYCAALYAGISVRERRPHSSPVKYVPVGMDATVSRDEGVDLKLQNPWPGPLLIKAAVGPGALTISIYGRTPNKRKTKISTENKEIRNGTLSCTTIRQVYSGRKELFSEILSRDTYAVCSGNRRGVHGELW